MIRVPSQWIPIGTIPNVLKYVISIAIEAILKKLAAAKNGKWSKTMCANSQHFSEVSMPYKNGNYFYCNK